MSFKQKFDMHTHTQFSHGKGTIMENAKEAYAKGLTVLGISDHGPGHRQFGMLVDEIKDMRANIEEAKLAFPKLEIKLGVEANIINPDGKLDIPKEYLPMFDYIMAGYHFGTRGRDSNSLHCANLVGNVFGFSKAVKTRNTDLVIAAINENKIFAITHPGAKGAVYLDEIAKACEETGTYLEINNRHGHLNARELKTLDKFDVKFVLGSDAHRPSQIGVFNWAIDQVIKSGIDPERIVNL